MYTLFLDPRAEGDLPPQCVVIETEVDFVRMLISNERDVCVRGTSLCRWARAVWDARGWNVVPVGSLADELDYLCPGLGRERTQRITEVHRQKLEALNRPLSLQAVTESIFPADLWRQQPSICHAAVWLLWLDEHKPEAVYAPLLQAWVDQWRSLTHGPEQMLYQAADAQTADKFLSQWIGYAEADPPLNLPVFPVSLPEHLLKRAETVWRRWIVATHGQSFIELSRRKIPGAAKERAANVTYQYYHEHPSELKENMIRSLAGYLSQAHLQELRAKLAPAVPPDPPAEPKAIFAWFRDQYMPYRQWALATENQLAREYLQSLGRKFATWYFDYYPRAIASGDHNIAFKRSAGMRDVASGDVTIVVILDGLHLGDASDLVRRLTRVQPRMTISCELPAFAALPTVTETCKPAIIYGCAPRDINVQPNQPNLRVLGETHFSQLREAESGDFFVWTIGDPDRAYHSKGDKETVRRKVDAALDSWAETIGEACSKVPTHLRLTVVITTDHGRLISSSCRSENAPQGMTVHQRAARGPCSHEFPKSGFFLDADSRIVLLHGQRFGISDTDHAAVVFSEASFYTSDGKAGEEFCPHGGAFPEEVILPWVVLQRDTELPSVACKASGKAREGTAGDIRLEVYNYGLIELEIESAELRLGEVTRRVNLSGIVGPLSTKQVEIPLQTWPKKHEARSAKIVVYLKLPAGDILPVAAETALDSDGFYVQEDDILSDLR